MAATKKAAGPRAVPAAKKAAAGRQVVATPPATSFRMQIIVGAITAVCGLIIGYFTRGAAAAVSDTHSGVGSWLFKFVWVVLIIGFCVIVGAGFGWHLDNRSPTQAAAQRTPSRWRAAPGMALVPLRWLWGHRRQARAFKPSRILLYLWLALGVIVGYYVTSRYVLKHLNGIDDGLLRFAAKLGLVVAGVLIGSAVFAWFAKKAKSLVSKAMSGLNNPAQPGPTP